MRPVEIDTMIQPCGKRKGNGANRFLNEMLMLPGKQFGE